MDDKIEIEVLDVRSAMTDLRAISVEDIEKLYRDSIDVYGKYNEMMSIIALNQQYKNPINGFLKKSNIASINVRNLLIFPGIIPFIANSHLKAVRCMTIKPAYMNNVVVYVPENTDIAVTGLKVQNLDIDINKDMYYFEYGDNKIRKVTDKDVDELREIFKEMLYFYNSNAYNYLESPINVEPVEYIDFFDSNNKIVYNLDRSERDFDKLKYIIEKIGHIKIENIDEGLSLLLKFGSFEYYYYVLTEGIESEVFNDYLKIVNLNETKAKNMAEQLLKRLKNQNLLSKYLIIIENKLGVKRYNELKNKSFLNIMAALHKNEKHIVETEYETEWKVAPLNKCEHIKLLQKMHKATLKELPTLLNSLKSLIKFEKADANNDSLYICKRCNLSLICPHLFEYYKSLVENWPFDKFSFAMQKYIMPLKSERSAYFCKICSGTLMAIERDIKEQISYDDDIKTFIWASVMQGLEIFTFIVPQNPRKIAQNAVPTILMQLSRKKKLNSDTERRIAAAIIAYAYILDLFIESKNMAIESVKGAKINIVADKILKQFSSRNFHLMRDVVNSSMEDISKQFIADYKELKGSNSFVNRDLSKEYISAIVNSTDYKYSYLIARLDGKLTKLSEKEQFELVTGKKIADLLTTKRPVVTMVAETIDFSLKELKLVPTYTYYETDKKKFDNYLEEDLYKSYNMYVQFTKYITTFTQYDEFLLNLAKYKKEHALKIFDYIYTPFIFSITMTEHIRYNNSEFLYSNVYDESGKKHKWDIYVFESGDVPRKNVNNNGTLIDMKCGICGIMKSSTNDLSEKKIKDVLTLNLNIKSLYARFKLECPEGDYHEFKGNVCKKCGIDFKNENVEYYNKYKVESVKNRKINIAEGTLNVYKIKKYDSEYTNIIKVAEINEIKPEQISFLGLTGGLDYKQMLRKGDSFKYEPLIHQDSRLYIVLGYIRKLIVFYYQYKNHLILENIHSHIKKILTEKYDLKDDIKYDFEPCENSFYTMEPSDTMKFLQNALCEVFLLIYKVNKEFAKSIFKYIIEDSKLLAKNEPVNIYAIYTETDDVVDDNELEDIDLEVEEHDEQNDIEQEGDE